jgi:hypothetical protein
MRWSGWFRLFTTGAVCLFVVLSLSSTSASSANISHAYKSSEAIQSGSLISLDDQQTDYVVAANSDNASRLLGIAVIKNDSLIAVNEAGGTIQVATNGAADTLVSTINGKVKVGDRVAVSAFSGIGMRAVSGSHYIGVAQTPFDGSTDGASLSVTDKAGKTHQVKVGYVKVTIQPGVNNSGTSNAQLNDLQRLVKNLTGKSASTVRVVMSIVVALVAIITIVSMIYGSINASIISIGRNPLAKHAIFRALRSLSGMVLAVALLATAIIAFLLR